MFEWPRRMAVFAALMLITVKLAAESSGQLRIELDGLEDASGNIVVTVYGSEQTWLGQDVVLSKEIAIEQVRQAELVVVELELPHGEYGLSIYYDANNNSDLDTNFFGIPKEPVALSNNAKARFGPPKWEDAVFPLGDEPVVQQIAIAVIE